MSTNFSRHQHKPRYIGHRRRPCDEYGSTINERIYMVQLNRPRPSTILSLHDDNTIEDDNRSNRSKWTIVRQRLPDIVALCPTHKPTTIQNQLLSLVKLMNIQSKNTNQLNSRDHEYNPSRMPSDVMINIGGRRRLICLKRIPSDQMIHVDVDQLSFSIPTRQLILAISRGNAHKTASRYCPPGISDLLINLSQTKVVDDGKQYKRALYKMRTGQMLFFVIFIFISGMMLALIVSTANTLFQLKSFNHTG